LLDLQAVVASLLPRPQQKMSCLKKSRPAQKSQMAVPALTSLPRGL
jgi:hypothetical protein